MEEEKELHEMVADLLAMKNNKSLIIEIFYRHKVDDQQLAKIVEANISAIEINLSDLKPVDVKDWEAFWLCINDPCRFKWLHNAKAHAYSSELQKRLALTIAIQENIYKQEHEKTEKEKAQLIRALDALKAISSPEYIAQLKINGKAHPIWKHYVHNFSSWDNLPAFVNVDVPNGDWIFGCDRRIWQISFYCSFICNNEKPFSIKWFDNWLQRTLGIKPPSCVKDLAIRGKKYPDLLPPVLNRISSWATLRAYFNHLCGLGMLEFSGDDRSYPGSAWFRVVSKTPRF